MPAKDLHHIALKTGDLDATVAELEGQGVPIDARPERKPWGLLEATVHDPEGTELVLVETPVDHPLRRRR